MDGNFLALMVAYSASTFQLTGKAEPQKNRGKNDLQKCRKMELYYIYKGVFHKIFSFCKMK